VASAGATWRATSDPTPQARRKPRNRATGGGSGPGKAAGEGGRREREDQMSKGGEVDQFYE
jgi:hypothetical protein